MKKRLLQKRRGLAVVLFVALCMMQIAPFDEQQDTFVSCALPEKNIVAEVTEQNATAEDVCNPETVSGGGIEPTAVPTPIAPTPEPKLEVSFAKKNIKVWPKKTVYNPMTIKKKNIGKVSIKWSVSDKLLASVSKSGKVTLKEKGAGKKIKVTVRISYRIAGKKKSKDASYVILGQKPVKSIKVTSKKNYVFVGKKITLKAACKPKNASIKKVKWSSSNSKYASISKNGVVKPKKAGAGKTVTFTAKAADGYKAKKKITLRIIDPKKPMVALTFDDGPSAMYTGRIVNQLKKYDARATFFVLGCNLNGKAAKEVVKKAAQNGNEIASHTYNHKRLSSLSVAELNQEMLMTKNAIKSITGTYPSVMRPPYGSCNDTVRNNVSMPIILWSIDTLDWKTRNQANTVSVVLNQVQDGSVILMHDIYNPTAGAAEQLIPALVQKGYQLVTVSELATYKKVNLKNGTVYTRIK